MKFRLMLASIVAVMASMAFAESAEEDYLCSTGLVGVLRVAMPEKYNQRVVIAVPWTEDGVNAVTVSNLVQTSTLTVGDKLRWYNPNQKKYMSWELAKDGELGTNYWKSVNEVDTQIAYDMQEVPTSKSSDQQELDRGQAALLERSNPETSTNIYLRGAVANSSKSVMMTFDKGYTLFAPPMLPTEPTAKGVDFTSGTWEKLSKMDKITFISANGSTMSFTWNGTAWSGSGTKVIPTGTGAWLKAKNEGVNVTWNDVPHL